jgi:glycosyltransferase involved in cell wall biosynthesis
MIDPRRVVQINTSDTGGGAERIALDLHSAYRAAGWSARLLVGHRSTALPGVELIPGDAARTAPARVAVEAARRLRPHAAHLAQAVSAAAQPIRSSQRLLGLEDFTYPGTVAATRAAADSDLVHAHNLHGGYFDLRQLGALTDAAPLLLTLHDAWLLSGHCGHSMGCQRWRTGCGHCPDLSIYPAVRRDATALNFRRKRGIYRRTSGFRVATPSRWLLDLVLDSMLAEHVVESRVVHNGVDTEAFAVRDAAAARHRLALPVDARVVLAVGSGLRANPFKDFAVLDAALRRLAQQPGTPPTVALLLGDDHPEVRVGPVTMRFVGATTDVQEVASYYNAADVLVHAARADTFPTAVLEALASGVPVVASAVGGIPEQVRSEESSGGTHEPTGVLVPPGDPTALATALGDLLADEGRRRRLGAAAARDARDRFDARRQTDVYVDWAEEIVTRAHAEPRGSA